MHFCEAEVARASRPLWRGHPCPRKVPPASAIGPDGAWSGSQPRAAENVRSPLQKLVLRFSCFFPDPVFSITSSVRSSINAFFAEPLRSAINPFASSPWFSLVPGRRSGRRSGNRHSVFLCPPSSFFSDPLFSTTSSVRSFKFKLRGASFN
jgi:hypothetical protein